MIRVLFTIPNFNTAGSGRALFNIAKGLDKTKFEAHIACKSDDGEFFKTLEKSGLPIHVFNYEAPMRPIIKLIQASWKISRKIREINPHVIHSFHYNNNYGEALAARLAGAKWVFTKKNMNWGNDGANAWKIRSALASRIIIQNTEMKSRFYPDSSKTTLIERGIEVQDFTSQEPQFQLREVLNTPHNARVIVTVANLVPVKGVEFLIEAFSSLANEYLDWHLWVIGDDSTDTGRALKSEVIKLNLSHRIHFAGKSANVRAYLDHSEIFVLPTCATGEGSPVALIEAMANGKVVIGTSVPGILDLLAHVPNHLVEPENAFRLAETMKRFLKNDIQTNRELGQSFKNLALKKYSIQREVEEHEKVYQGLISL